MSYIVRSALSGSAVEEPNSLLPPAAAGFAVAAAFSILLFKFWPLHSLDLAVAFSELHHPAVTSLIASGFTAGLAFVAGISAAFALARTINRMLLQAAALGAWAGPVVLLATGRAPLLLFAAALLAPAVARLFRSEVFDPEERRMFDLLDGGDGGFVRTAAAALALHVSVIAVANQRIVIASILVCGALAAMRRVMWRRRSAAPRPRFGSLLAGTLLFAFLGTVPLGGGQGPFPEANQSRKVLTPTNQEGDYNGLFLHPKPERIVTLVPPLPSLRSAFIASPKDNPYRVPFFGIYWVFRSPELAPPPASFRGEGDPEGMNLRSMDGRPIRVEARQHFGRIIDLRCCFRIQVQVRNSDRYPGTVSMELLLRDSRNRSMASLGSHELRSTQRFRLYDNRTAVKETVDYAVPAGAAPFDEAVVRFHLEKGRERRAAKIAIEAFVFVPNL